MRVCLDAGHGGRDSGATFEYGAEKDYALVQALIAESFCVAEGHAVRMTRREDLYVGLRQRALIANRWEAEAFVSFHWNSASTVRASGTQCLHHADSEEAERLAGLLLEEVAPLDGEPAEPWERLVALPDPDYRVTEDGRPFVPTVLSATRMPAVILEVEFGSSPEDAQLMLSGAYQLKVGQAVARAVGRFQEGGAS